MSNIDLSSSSSVYLSNIDNAYKESSDWRFDRSLYGSSGGTVNTQVHHVIPKELLTSSKYGGFLEQIGAATEGTDSPFRFSTDGLGNLVVLPTTAADANTLEGVRTNHGYAAMHTGSHADYTNMVEAKLTAIRGAFEQEVSGLPPGSPEYAAAASRAGNKIDQLKLGLQSGLQNADLDGIRFVIRADDSLQSLRYDNYDQLDENQQKVLRQQDYDNAGDLSGNGFVARRMEADGSIVNRFDNQISHQLKLITSNGASGKIEKVAIWVTISAVMKMVADYLGKTEITLEEFAEFVANTGLNIDKETLINIAEDAAFEAGIELALSALRGPLVWIYTAYQIYQSYDALRGAMQLAGAAFPDVQAIKYVNESLDMLESSISGVWDSVQGEQQSQQIIVGSIDLGTFDTPENTPEYTPPSATTFPLPVFADNGEFSNMPLSEWGEAFVGDFLNMPAAQSYFSAVNGQIEYTGAPTWITAGFSNDIYNQEYSFDLELDAQGNAIGFSEIITIRSKITGDSITYERNAAIVSQNINEYGNPVFELGDVSASITEKSVGGNLTGYQILSGSGSALSQLSMNVAGESAIMQRRSDGVSINSEYYKDSDGNLVADTTLVDENGRESGILDLDHLFDPKAGLQSFINEMQGSLRVVSNPMAGVPPEAVFPQLLDEVEPGQVMRLIIDPFSGKSGAVVIDESGNIHARAYQIGADPENLRTIVDIYPEPVTQNTQESNIIVRKDDGRVTVLTKQFNSKTGKYEHMPAGYYGQQFGSAFGQILGLNGSEWEKQISSVFFGTIGAKLEETLLSTTSSHTFDEARDDAFSDFGQDFTDAAESAGKGYISSLIVSATIRSLGLEDDPKTAEALSAAISPLANVVISATVDAAVAAAFGETVNFSSDVAAGVDAIDYSAIVATYLGKRLGQEAYDVETREGSITGSVGAAVGAKLGFEAGFSIGGGPVGGFVGAVVGATVGYLTGSKLGDLFGMPPKAGADVVYDPNRGEFYVTHVWAKGGAQKSVARNLAKAASEMLNQLVASTGGEIVNEGEINVGTFGIYKDKLKYEGKKFGSTSDFFNYGITHSLAKLDIAGGDIYVKRAIYLTIEDMLKSGLEDGKDVMSVLAGQIVIGTDYSNYKANEAAINTLMLLQPDTAFTETWHVAQELARQLGITRRHVSDSYGGWRYVFDQQLSVLADSLDGDSVQGASYAQARFTYNNNERIVETTLANGHQYVYADHVSGTDKKSIDFTTQQALDDLVDSSSADAFVITGDDSENTINASDLGDDLFGLGGNDTLVGGALNDWIDGGEDNDTIDSGGGNNNILIGDLGNDTLLSREGSDWLTGGEGRDILDGNGGADILDGGTGDDDQLRGGAGNDVYIFRRGYGADIIADFDPDFDETKAFSENIRYGMYKDTEWGEYLSSYSAEQGGGVDVIEFDAGISLSDINLYYSTERNELIITLLDENGEKSADSLAIKNWNNIFHRIEILRFADGEVVDLTNIQSFINGTSGDDAIIGTNGADFISAGAGDDVVDALAGDDVVAGGKGSDIISGGTDHDLIVGGSGRDNLYGSDGNDVVAGEAGDDVVYGGSGDDTLSGGSGDDFIITGSGNDTVLFGHGDGKDELIDSYSSVNPVLAASIKIDIATKKLQGKTFESGFSSDGRDGTIAVWDQEDNRLGAGFFGQVRSSDNSYFDIYHVQGNVNSGNDTLEFKYGVSLSDIRVKRDGNDLLIGLEDIGKDGEGFDQLKDLVRLKGWFSNGIKGIENFRIFGVPEDLNITTFSQWLSGSENDNGDDIVVGGDGRDWITTGAGDDHIEAKAGDDIISAGSGDDTVVVGDGDKIILGGDGTDTLSYKAASLGRYINLGQGKYYSASEWQQEKEWNSTEANENPVERVFLGDRAVGFENLVGSDYDDVLVGDNADNELTGGAGNDYLVGSYGDDRYHFNQGDGSVVIAEFDSELGVDAPDFGPEDTKYSGEDVLVFGEGISQDSLNFSRKGFDLHINVYDSSDSITLKNWFLDDSRQIEKLEFSNGTEIDIRYLAFYSTASDFADWVGGDAGNNQLNGLAGNDILSGREGNDILNGGAGDDSLYGGTGADQLIGGEGQDAVYYADSAEGIHIALNNSIVATGGSAAGDTFSGIEAVVGSAFEDEIQGDAYNNILNGQKGNDRLWGGDGADTLQGGEGNDTLYGERGMDALSGHQGEDTLYGGTGDDILSGGDDKDTLFGGAHNDTLYGDDGDDTLHGGSDQDSLIGGAGNDTLYGDSGEDDLRGGEGNDIIHGGADKDKLFGEEGSDSLYGDDGDDYLAAGAGDDSLSGGSGDDVIDGGSGDDDLFGDSGDDTLTGGDGNDLLVGGAGADYLIGGTGNDHLEGGSGSDVYIFSGDFGQDTVYEAPDRQASDELIFSGYNLKDLWFTRQGTDLIISAIGTDNQLTIENYDRFNVNSAAAQAAMEKLSDLIDSLQPIKSLTLDTQRLDSAAINALVDSMAGYDIPASVDDVPAAIVSMQTDLAIASSPDEVISYAPDIIGQVLTLEEDGTYSGVITAADRNPGDVLTYRIAEYSKYGDLTLNAQTGEYTFTPVADFSGNAVFRIEVTDSSGLTDVASLRFRVTPVDDTGSFINQIAIVTGEGTARSGSLNFSDPDNVLGDYQIEANSSLGEFNFNADGSFVFTPFDNANGSEQVTLRFTDPNDRVYETLVNIDIASINDRPVTAPVIDIDAYEDSSLSGQIAVTDADPEDTHRFEVISQGLGTLTLNQNGYFDYQLAENFAGIDRFTIRVYDSSGDMASYSDSEVVINVTEVNDTPTALSQLSLVTAEDTSVSGNLQVNDVDLAYGDQLSFSASPNAGQIVFNADGTFQYYPDADVNGTDQFVVTITDARGASATTYMSVTVTAVNDAPITDNSVTLSMQEDGAVTGAIGLFDADTQYGDSHIFKASPGLGDIVFNADGTFRYTPRANVNGTDTFTVLVTDSVGATSSTQVTINIAAVNDAPVSLSVVELTTAEDNSITGSIGFADVDLQNEGDSHNFTAQPNKGIIAFNADGTFVYTPDANVNGKDEFDIIVTDDAGATSTTHVVMNITPVNDAPVTAAVVSVNTLEDNQITGSLDLVDPDTANEGDSYTFSANPALGNIVFTQDGRFVYTPTLNANGIDRFNVTVRDSAGNESVSEVVVDIAPVNDVPNTVDVFASIEEDTTLTLRLPVSDVDGDSLVFTPVSQPAHGVVTIDGNGILNYQPVENFFGSDRVLVDVDDGHGGISRLAVNLYVNPVNDDPFAYDLVLEADSGQMVSGAIWASDFDPQDILTYQIDSADGVENGSLTLNSATGVFSYQSASDFSGTDSFTVKVDDNAGGTTSLRVAVIVSDASALEPGNEAPQFSNLVQYVSTDEDQPLELDLRATDGNGDTLSYELDNSLSSGRGQLIQTATAGVFRFIPDENINGADAFRITVSDGRGGRDSLLLQVAINPVNDAPLVSDTSVAVNEDTQVTGLLNSVVDVDGDTLTYRIADQAGHGSVTIDSDSGRFIYQGNSNFNGTDSFNVLVEDGNGGSAVAAVLVTVNAVNDAPDVASVINLTGQEDTAVSGMLNASDVDGDLLSYRLATDQQPSHGNVRLNADGSFVYIPDLNYNGSDTFAILVDDGQGQANSIRRTTVHITAQATNDAPYDISWLGVFSINENSASGIVGTAMAQDVDLLDAGSTEGHTYSLLNNAGGRFAINTNTGEISVTASAALDYETNSSHTIRVRVTDKGGLSYEEDRVIQINDINEAPTGIQWSNALNVAENTQAGVLVATASAVDADQNDSHTFTLLDNAGDRFRIDANSGNLYTNSAGFDYETTSAYTLRVQVTDAHGKSYQQNVAVSVSNVNEAPTNLTVSGTLTVQENASAGQLVAKASATDPEYSSISYSISGADSAAFTIDSSGNIRTAKSFDYESKQSYTLTVNALDSSGLTSSRAVTIAVTNINEAPTSLTLSGTLSVRENAGANQLVATVSATDPENNAVSYSIIGTDSLAFSIDASGNIRTVRSFDYESKPSYAFTVIATDSSGLSTSRGVTIAVTNQNEQPGTITIAQAIGVDETTAVNSQIGVLSAIDPDGDTLTFTLDNNANGQFAISADGKLTLAKAIAVGTDDTYPAITVRATDSSGAYRTQTFTIPVDHDATPTDLAWSEAQPSISENAAAGTVVGAITVTDPDTLDAYRQWTFDIDGNDASGRFVIDANTGVISVGNTALDVTADQDYQVRVRVTDKNNPLSFKDEWLKINVINENSVPVIVGTASTATYEFAPWDNQGAFNGKHVYSLDKLFTDEDGDSLDYSIVSGNEDNAYIINGHNLLVNDASLLDYEVSTKRRVLKITANDGKSSSEETSLEINLVNIEEVIVIATVVENVYFQNSGTRLVGRFSNSGTYINTDKPYVTYTIHNYSKLNGFDFYNSREWSHSDGYDYARVGYDIGVFDSGRLVWGDKENSKHNNAVIGNSQTAVPDYYTVSSYVLDGIRSDRVSSYDHGAVHYTIIEKDVESFYYHSNPPVVLDLAGNGFSWQSNIYFDQNSDGNLEITPWISSDDALLALDRNGDGAINNGGEISFVADLAGATTDLEGLAAFDSNNNDLLDAGDERFAEFLVWQDVNSNGISEAGELRTLAEAGIESITLKPLVPNSEPTGVSGVELLNTSVFTRTDGTQSTVGDVRFSFEDIDPNNPAHSLLTAGTDNADEIKGTLTADRIESYAGNDRIYTSEGNDWAKAGDGDDLLFMGDGDDIAEGGAGNDTLYGEAGNDTLSGDAGDDLLVSGEGDDQLDGGDGNDTLQAGAGDDQLTGGAGNDQLDGGEGNDWLDSGDGDDVLTGGAGDDILFAGTGNDSLSGGSGINQIIYRLGDGADVITAADGTYELRLYDISASDLTFEQADNGLLLRFNEQDSLLFEISSELPLTGITFNDTLHWDQQLLNNEIDRQLLGGVEGSIVADNISGSAGKDKIDTYFGNDVVHAAAGDDEVYGYGGDDQLYGEQGNDILDGGAGNDILDGGDGNDRLYGQNGADQLLGGAGSDTLYGGADDDQLSGGGEADTLYGGEGNDLLAGEAGDDILTGDAGDDELSGGDGVDQLYGSEGNDRLSGDAGDDYLQGDEGNDELIGGAGNDILNAGEGDDVLYGGDDQDLLVGDAGDDTLHGGTDTDSLFGDRGNDYLDGGEGADNMFGGLGDDTYIVDNADDVIEEREAEGNDTVQTYVDRTLEANLENIVLLGDALNATGNELNNILTGNNRNNILDGGTGQDTMSGGAGDDTYVVDNLNDQTIELAGEGYDLVLSSVDYQLADQLEALTLTGTALSALGNSQDNTLTGNELDNTLGGGSGDDILQGGKGNDILDGGSGHDRVVFARGDGQDLVKQAAGMYAITLIDITPDELLFNLGDDGVLTLEIGDSDSIRFEGMDLYDSEDSLPLSEIRLESGENVVTLNRDEISRRLESALATQLGNDRNNFLVGSCKDDRIAGLGGNDYLLGLLGDDILLGGSGNDSIYAGLGNDHLLGGLDNDYLNAGIGNDYLNGGVGNDWLDGGHGDDTYRFDIGDGNDVIEDSSGDNRIRFGVGITAADLSLERDGRNLVVRYGDSDSITVRDAFKENWFSRWFDRQSWTFSFSDGSELTLDQLREISPLLTIGNRHSNRLAGDNLADIMHGKGGNDSIYGAGGNDTLYGDVGRDVLSGGDGNDQLFGGADNDHLYGDDGDDILNGGQGNDILQGGAGNDTYVFGAESGHDRISNRDRTGMDILQIDESLSLEDLMFSRKGRHLVVKSLVSDAEISVDNWFRGSEYQLDIIAVGEQQLTVDMVNQLVQAQASMGAGSEQVLHGHSEHNSSARYFI